MNAVAMTAQKRSRLQLILLAALFVAPVAGAWLAWKYAVTQGVATTTNAGELVQPARPLQSAPWLGGDGEPVPASMLTGRWSYVLLAGQACESDCLEKLYLTRQMRLSVNKDMSRVQRVLMLSRPPANLAQLRSEHPDLTVAVIEPGAWQAFVDQFPVDAEAPAAATVYVVDPLGNLMMRYRPGVPFKGILKDLRKLLKASQVG